MSSIVKIVPAYLMIFLLTVACGSGSNNSKEASSTQANSINESCLTEFANSNAIEKIITAEQVAAIVGQVVDSLEYSESKSSRSKYSTFGYEWNSEDERFMVMEMKVGDQQITQKIRLKNQVDIGNIEVLKPKNKSPLEYFKFVYGPKTQKQKEQAKQAIDDAKNNNDKVDENAANIVKKMVDKEKTPTLIEDLGDAAYWTEGNTSGMVFITLRVLQANTMFKITADVSKNSQIDLKVAKALAKQIISNCQEK